MAGVQLEEQALTRKATMAEVSELVQVPPHPPPPLLSPSLTSYLFRLSRSLLVQHDFPDGGR